MKNFCASQHIIIFYKVIICELETWIFFLLTLFGIIMNIVSVFYLRVSFPKASSELDSPALST